MKIGVLSDDWRRAQDAFARFADATANPYLMVECTPADLRRESRWIQEPARVVDALAALIERLGFRLILCGKVVTLKQKLTVGELMLRLMMAHAYQQELEYSCDTEINKLLSQLERNETTQGGRDDPPSSTPS
jgi:hypothetical protein